jgi:putative peptidoglycan lipid II flippase
MLALPAAVALAVLAVPLIASLFLYGEFSAHDLWMTREALIAYSIGLLGLILVKVLAPGFYARQNIKTPVKIAIFTLVATQLMNLMFVWQLRHAGLALAIALGACLNAGLLYYHLRRADIFRPLPGWGWFLAKLLLAVSLMAAVLWLGMGDTEQWLHFSAIQKFLRLSLLVLAGAASYFGALWLMGFRVGDFVHRAQ